jgi:hypothetical protein
VSGLLTTDSVLMCPHGGTVTVTTSNNRVFVNGAAVLRETDDFAIPDCPFPPTGTPHPCVTVQWQTTGQRSSVMDDATLNDSCQGICLAADDAPQGTVVMSMQQTVSGE